MEITGNAIRILEMLTHLTLASNLLRQLARSKVVCAESCPALNFSKQQNNTLGIRKEERNPEQMKSQSYTNVATNMGKKDPIP